MHSPRAGAEAEFFPVPLGTMQPGTSVPVDLYLRREDPPGFVLYKKATAPLTDEARQRLLARDRGTLYVRLKDEDGFLDYVEEQIGAIVRDELMSTEKVWAVTYRTSARVMRRLFENPRSGKNIRRAAKMADSIVQAILRSENPLEHILSLLTHDYYTYTHSLNVCVLLSVACKEIMQIKEPDVLREIGQGAILHDLGKTRIPKKILNKPGKLTDKEFALVKKHPADGVEMASEHVSLSETAVDIIRHHHEHWDGGGYPDGLTEEQISPLARLSTVVDVYDAITTDRPYADASTPYGAVRIMIEEMLGQLHVPTLRAFIRFLGPEATSTVQRQGRARRTQQSA